MIIGRTALILAVLKNKQDFYGEEIYTIPNIILLLEYGADMTIRDNYGKTALDYAKENNDTEVIALLNSYIK